MKQMNMQKGRVFWSNKKPPLLKSVLLPSPDGGMASPVFPPDDPNGDGSGGGAESGLKVEGVARGGGGGGAAAAPNKGVGGTPGGQGVTVLCRN